MRKISLVILIFLSLSFTNLLRADEGMWLMTLIEKLNSKQMSKMGCKLSAKDIYDINHASLKDAIVHFGGGCTAEIVSDQGLLLTNHHCGYASIQRLSTVDHDYLQDGYWAMSKEKELPSEGLSVTFLERFEDVTDAVKSAFAKATNDEDREKEYAALSRSYSEKVKAENRYFRSRIVSFFGGNQYYLVVTKTYSDVRFVGAPPSSIGKFGADTDNWMWPRHTGDFSVFRIYADKDNNPAEYSPDNVPYTPKKHLSISLKGIKQDDFAMIIGYPGRTFRYMTSSEIKERKEISNAVRIKARGIRQEILMKDMLADPKVRIQYSNKYAGSSNYWKNSIGMNQTLDRLKVEPRRVEEERVFMKWVNEDSGRTAKYGAAINMIDSAIANRAEALYLTSYINEALLSVELLSFSSGYMRAYNALAEDHKQDAVQMIKNRQPSISHFFKDYSASTDKKVAKTMLRLFRESVKVEDLPSFYSEIDSAYNGDIDKFVDDLFSKSVFSDEAKVNKLEGNPDLLKSDPAMQVILSIVAVYTKAQEVLVREADQLSIGQEAYIAGQMEYRESHGKAMYPDANSTMRMTYGKVRDYSPRDAVMYDYVTTLDGVMEKEDPNNWEFVVPAKLKELYKAKDYGQYAMKNGKQPLAFISTNDITGGNSGSPVMNGKGELIGIAFDGNWEAMSGDILFEPNLQRTISVDIRYVLFIIDKFGGAGHLLKEMTIVR